MRVAKFFLISLLVVAAATACSSYRSGHSRTYGELADDAAIQTRVKTTLISASEINGLRIDVDVRRGVVWLRGKVASEAARQEALRRTRAVKGVVRVESHLTVVTK